MSEDLPRRFAANPIDGGSTVVDHSVWQRLLTTHVHVQANGLNRVSYAGFKAEFPALVAYLDLLAGAPIDVLGRAEQFAYWCNLYNALVVKVVVEHYPIASIRDITLGGTLLASLTGGPWKAKLVTIAGVPLSLDDIEHTILRGVFKEPRVHYALNCGSIGCPNLRRRPFVGRSLDEDLNDAARDFINSPRGLRIEGDQLVLSGIFKWYRRDFGGHERDVLAHVAQYADAGRRSAIARGLAVARYDYDWRLNDLAASEGPLGAAD